MQSWASAVSAVAFAADRFAQRCPPCPSCSCAAVSVALKFGGAASTGPITSSEDSVNTGVLSFLLIAVLCVGTVLGVTFERRRAAFRGGSVVRPPLAAKGLEIRSGASLSEGSDTSAGAPVRSGLALTPSAKRIAVLGSQV